MRKYINKLLNLYDARSMVNESLLLSIIIVIIDKFNLFSHLLKNNLLLIFTLLIVYWSISFFNRSNIQKIKLNNINELDKLLFEYPFVFLLLLIYVLSFDYKLYKLIMLNIILLIYLIILYIRLKKCKLKEKPTQNVLDLKKICSEVIDLKEYNDIVLIEESDIKYDLLNRTGVINNLYNVLTRCFPQKSFTIGLNGKWGCGKTTIINNVLNNIETSKEAVNYIIVKFDPWLFNSEEAMIKSFLREIFKNMNFSISSTNKDEIINEIVTSVFPPNYQSILKDVMREIKKYKKNPSITKIVNEYLESNEKKLVIIIDNLDRIDGQKALFLIKFLDTVLNFENTINILLYDEEIINRALNEKFSFDGKYMEKLVQLKIDVPIVDRYTMNLIKNNVSNNLIYGDKKIIDFVNNELYEFDNLRELKRYLNLIISSTIDTNAKLNSNDYALLKYIQLKCPDLYYEIWSNKKYYILYDRKYDLASYTFDYDKLNSDADAYFKNLYKEQKYDKYLGYAEKLFPNMVNSKKDNYPIFSNNTTEEEYNDSVLNDHISNARYFSSYFTDEENDFVRLKTDVTSIITKINESKYYYKELKLKIKNYTPDELKVFMEIFCMSTDKISKERIPDLIKKLISLFPYTKKRILFGELDSKQRLYIIIAELLSHITRTDYNKLKESLIGNYKQLSVVSGIKYWIDVNKNKGVKYKFNFDDLHDNLCREILYKNIDIYNLNNYARGNIWALCRYNEQETQKYLKRIINKDNIYLLLGDLLSVSSDGNEYGYFIKKENINHLIPEVNIEQFMKNKKLTKTEKFIKKVYNESKSQSDNNLYEKAIYLDKYIE